MNGIPSKEAMDEALIARHGKEFHTRMSEARVVICGLGGLGSNVAIALARAGIGSLHLIDFDRVDLSNLNRQQYFVNQLGLFKTEALKENLAAIAPYCRVTTETVRLTEENIPELLCGFPIICEAFDKAETKAMLVNAVLENFPNAWLVSGNGMAGVGSANLIRTRRVGKRLVLCGDGVSGIETGESLVSARVLACAAHEALAIIKIIIGKMDFSDGGETHP
ncbi:MAG: sulfur carrier protein ThiS adenylyltransferase ThiF [Victivallales bacterium]|nr:sulfur carrier protein ThiS adenylyltransferase ThiF [Victivallales bacterium]